MLIEEENVSSLKKWIVKRLEDISDADSDVLADYVLALVRSEDSDDQVKQNCLENLEDFLRAHTSSFVEDAFRTIKTQSYKPGYEKKTTAPSSKNYSAQRQQTGTDNLDRDIAQNGNTARSTSRKRQWEGGEERGGRDSHYNRGIGSDHRAMKQVRRGGHRSGFPDGGRGGRSNGYQNKDIGPSVYPAQSSLQMPQMPGLPPNFPQLDPSNPLAAMMAMQAMGFPPMPTFPGPPMTSPQAQFSPVNRIKERCKDYDTKGFCALGSTCPYEHGTDHIVVSDQNDEYDPKNAMVGTQASTNGHTSPERGRRGVRGRFRGRGQNERGSYSNRNHRASFSHAGPNGDRNVTSVVVEQIPEDKFDQQIVQDFFSEFGKIVNINMQAYKRLAIVKYEDYFSAKRAYESPKVIFENRFVKVYWYKPDSVPVPPVNGSGQKGSQGESTAKPDEEMIDPAEFERRQGEAQKAYEEKAKKLKEAESQREELDKKLKMQAEERKRLLEKLSAKAVEKGSSSSPIADKSVEDAALNATTSNDAEDSQKSAQTDALKKKLAELEAEAESMGINPQDSYFGNGYGAERGRGTSRGRGPSFVRGRGNPYRASPRGGRGTIYGAVRGGAVKRLDNRTKKVAVSGVEFGTERDEALRQHLFNNYEFDSIDPHPEQKGSQVVTFKERYVAENFMAQSSDVPSLGRLEVSWHNAPISTAGQSNNLSNTTSSINAASNNDIKSTTASAATDLTMNNTTSNSSLLVPKSANDTPMDDGNAMTNSAAEDQKQLAAPEVDYDVADDEDRWMAT